MLIRRMLGLEDGQKVDKRKPGHGPCCTCQKCGYDHDNCKCWENAKVEICEYVEATQAENAELKKLIKGNEEICRQRNRELLLHKAAAKAARSGLKTDLDAYIKLLKDKDNGLE